MFQIQRPINVYETDLMGIVHHSNYLRFCEEARVGWCRKKDIINGRPESVFALTVYETQVRHLSPSKYGEILSIELQAQAIRAKIYFQYRLKVGERIVAYVKTIHCRLDPQFKVQRLDQKTLLALENEKWTETWLSNL